MKPMTRGVAIALLQVLLISSLGGKLLYDRWACPRVWFKTRRYDPNLPIRGRYISLQLEVKDPRSPEEIESKFRSEIQARENLRAHNSWHGPFDFGRECGSIAVRDGVPVAVFDKSGVSANCENLSFTRQHNESAANGTTLRLNEIVMYFVPDTAEVPSGAGSGDEIWVLATIPRRGPPRPIELGIKKAGESAIQPVKLD